MKYKTELTPQQVERVLELYSNTTTNKAEISRLIISEFDINDVHQEAMRKRVRNIIQFAEDNHDLEGIKGGFKSIKVKSFRNPNSKIKKDKFVLSAWNKETGMIMSIDEYCEVYNLPRSDIRDYKLVSHTGTPFWNIHFKENVAEISDILDKDFLEEVVSRNVSRIKYMPIKRETNDKVIRAIYTDTHIGMSPNPEGHSLFGGVWNEVELMDRLTMFCHDVIEKAVKEKSSVLFIDDLGDFMDGWEGQTVRREHSLPQNLTSSEAFDAGVKFKVSMIDMLVDSGIFSSITLNNICNDNHAGAFGYVVNSALKSILEAKYGMVEVINHKRFINHYFIGSHCIMITHGKDEKHMKFGFTPQIKEKHINSIIQYMRSNELFHKAEWFEFSKGDSHQMLFDYSSSDDFKYMNYPAFSPSSDWVQTNFKKGKSGYVIQTIDPHGEEVEVIHRVFDWKGE